VNRRHIKITYLLTAPEPAGGVLTFVFVTLVSYLMTYCLLCLFAHEYTSQFSLVPAHGFWATVCETVRPMLSVRCLSCPVCLSVTFVHCGQTVGRIKTKLGIRVGFGPGHIVLDGDPVPLPKRGGGRAPSPILRLRIRISKLDRMCGALPVVANFVALEQQIILVKTRSESV